MASNDATARVFWVAFKALPKKQRSEVIRLVARDRSTRRDLLDLATIENRRKESSRSLRAILSKPKGKR